MADSRSHLLLLLRVTHNYSGADRLGREAKNKDTIADTVGGRYSFNKKLFAVFILHLGFFIGHYVEINRYISQHASPIQPVSSGANRLLYAVAKEKSSNIRRWLIK